MTNTPLDYETPPPPPKRPFFTPAGWLLLSGFLAFGAFSAWFSRYRLMHVADVAVIIGFAVAGVLALVKGFRSAARRAKARE